MFEKAKKEIVTEIKRDVAQMLKDEAIAKKEEELSPDGSVNLDTHKEMEAFIKQRLGATHVIISAQLLDGTVLTYIAEEVGDKDLVYLIQMLKDLRDERVNGN